MWSSFGLSSPESLHAARRVIVDQVAVSLRGVSSPSFRDALDAEPCATRWSDGKRLHAASAVLANRIAADDLELTAGPELGAAALAAAEIADARLGKVLEAVTLACEVESGLRAWLQEGIERKGLHPPAVLSAASAAVVAARILGLEGDDAWNAVTSAIALAPRSPYPSFSEGVTGKWLYGAWGQRLGLEAALWARKGISGPRTVLDGRRGIARAFGLEGEAPAFRGPEGSWAIERVAHKRFGCSRACHPTLAALESLGSLATSDIDHVAIETYPFAFDLEQRVRAIGGPASSIAAQMSVRQAAALWLVEGTLRWERYDTPEVRRLVERIAVRSNGGPDVPSARLRTATVRVTMKDGKVHTGLGDGEWLATDEALMKRFEGLELPARLWQADEAEPVRRLMAESYRG